MYIIICLYSQKVITKQWKNKPETNELVTYRRKWDREKKQEKQCFCEYKFLHSFDLI